MEVESNDPQFWYSNDDDCWRPPMNAIPPLRQRSLTAFADLPFGGQLSLWAVRLWVNAERECPAVHQTIRTGFRLAGLPDAHKVLHALLTILVNGARGVFSAGRCNDPYLTADERLLLICLAHHQDGASVDACQALMTWIGPLESRAAMAASRAYALLLAARNLKAYADQPTERKTKSSAMCGCGCGCGEAPATNDDRG